MKKRIYSLLTMALVLLILGTSLPVQAKAKIKLSAKKKTLAVAKTFTLKVKGTKKKVKWSSSKKAVATVTKKGKVRAKKAGTCWIRAKVAGKTLKCKVKVIKKSKPINTSSPTVSPAPEIKTPTTVKVTVSGDKSMNLDIGATKAIPITTVPAGVGRNTLTWKNENPDIVKIDSSGNVTGLKAGIATVWVNGGDLSDYCIISVKDPYAETEYILAAKALNDVYNSAKYPSTLHIRKVLNRKGYYDVLLESYSMNGFGGYGEIYTHALEDTNGNTIINTSDSCPVVEENFNLQLDTAKVLKYYQHIYNTTRTIPYDN